LQVLWAFLRKDWAKNITLALLWTWLLLLVIGVFSIEWSVAETKLWIFLIPMFVLVLQMLRAVGFFTIYYRGEFENYYNNFARPKMK